MSSVQQLDRHMTARDAGEGLQWHDARQLRLEGQGWPDVARPYARLPGRAQAMLSNPAVWDLAQCSAGLCLRFCTDAASLSARWRLLNAELALPHMPATGVSGLDLYVRHERRWRWLGVGRPEKAVNRAMLAVDLPPQVREYRLYLPLYNGVEELELGLPAGSRLEAAPAYPSDRQRPICFYGTSIVQGGCASRPGMAHVAILGRRLDRPVLNLGFSGNGRMEGEVATLLAELDPEAYVLDCLPNLDERATAQRVEPFVRSLRSAHPQTPIVLVENIAYTNAYLLRRRYEEYTTRNTALRSAVARLTASGIGNVQLVPCEALLGQDDEATVDGTHPTDVGFLRLADALEPILREAIAPAAGAHQKAATDQR